MSKLRRFTSLGALGLLLVFLFSLPADGQGRLSPQGGTIVGATTGGGLVTTNSKLGLLTSCSSNQVLQWNGSSWVCAAVISSASGTTNTVAKFTGASSLGNSGITDDGSIITIPTTLLLAGTNGYVRINDFDTG